MKLAKLAAALAVIMMMTVVAAPAVTAEDSVDLTATVLEPKPEIGIELNATALSFGSLYPGNTSDDNPLRVTSIGLKTVDVTAEASDDQGQEALFVPGLLIDSASWTEYESTLATDQSDDLLLALHIPDDYASRGDVSGGATFWAEEHSNLPVADFSADVTIGDVPLTVQFTDLSTNSPIAWSWDFGDGATSIEQNPSHTYNAAGTYTVSLTATNLGGSDIETKTAYVDATSRPITYSTALENTNPEAPDPGIPGFVGPDGDGMTGWNNVVNPAFTAWASKVIDYSPTIQEIGEQWKDPTKALGPVTGDNFDIVSLGDLDQAMIILGELPGSLVLGFDVTIVNGPGPDFAAFENGFISGNGPNIFAELGYVEVSTDGVTFARFPSVSLISGQAGGYGSLDATNLYNLVGKHVNAYGDSWGTPFDLNDLAQSPEVLNGSVDLNNINYVRIVDIPGSGDFKDSRGNPIYDAWVTWGSGGVDFEALGVLNSEVKASPATDFTTSSDGSAVTITGYVGPGGDVIIPGEIEGLPVTSIGEGAFRYNTNMTSVTIPDSVTSFGESVFRDCSALTVVNIGNGVTSIGKYAFRQCASLTSIIIPDSVTSMGTYVFRDCSALSSVTLGSGVTDININIFSGCNALASIDVDAGNTVYASFDGVLYDKAVTTPILCPKGKTSVTIPDSVTSIGIVFRDSIALTALTIGNGVTSIGNEAFSGCSALNSLTIPDSVTSIGSYAFGSCSALTSVIIPDSVTTIDSYAFKECTALASVIIPDSVTSIGQYGFYVCTALTAVTIGNGVTSIGQGAFGYCTALTAINVDAYNGAYSSVDGVLYDKAATTLIQCPLTKASIVIPASVKIIGESAFEYSNALTSVTIPDSVIYIGKSAFSSCANLTSVTIPDSVTSIGGQAFSDCTALASVSMGAGLTMISNSAFSGCIALTSVIIPDSVTTIDSYAFKECTALASVTLSNNVTTIGDSVFHGCTAITSIIMPKSVTNMGYWSFRDCTALTSMTFEGNAPTVVSNWANGVPSTMIVYYHAGATGFTDPWNGFTTVELP